MKAEITLRPATLADAEELAALHAETWHHTYRDLIPAIDEIGFTLENQIANWRDNLGEGGSEDTTLLAFDATGKLVGFVCAGAPQEDAAGKPISSAEVHALYVLPSRQRQGIGLALLRAAFEALADRGFSDVALWVLAENPACGFYERLGGKVTGSRQRDWHGKTLIRLGYRWAPA